MAWLAALMFRSASGGGMGPSDQHLVRAARDGDRDAFAALVSEHWDMLLSLCARMLRDRELGRDAAQEAVLQALLGIDRLESAASFGPWLVGIGLNVSRRWLHTRGREETLWGPVSTEPADPGPSPEELALAADVGRRVREAISALPPGQRAAVALFYLADLDQAETAVQLGIAEGAVKTRLYKARASLRGQLQDVWKEQKVTHEPELVPMFVMDVRRRVMEVTGETTPVPTPGSPARYVILLREGGGERLLPIWVGETEAKAIVHLTTQLTPVRPLSHELTARLIEALGGQVTRVTINALVEGTFYSEVDIASPSGTSTVDARPSDAISLALSVGAPILASALVLNFAGYPNADALGTTTAAGSRFSPSDTWESAGSIAAEIERLSAERRQYAAEHGQNETAPSSAS